VFQEVFVAISYLQAFVSNLVATGRYFSCLIEVGS